MVADDHELLYIDRMPVHRGAALGSTSNATGAIRSSLRVSAYAKHPRLPAVGVDGSLGGETHSVGGSDQNLKHRTQK